MADDVMDAYWHCACGSNEPAQPEYNLGDFEPCVHCADGTAVVVTLREAAAWEQAKALGREWSPVRQGLQRCKGCGCELSAQWGDGEHKAGCPNFPL